MRISGSCSGASCWLRKQQKSIVHAALLLVMALAVCYPLLETGYQSGRDDWDFFSFLHEVAAVTIFEYHQFPLWNPYSGGGMPLLGNPQAGFLSPIFLCTSLFGVIAGIKIAVWLHTFIGLWGMWMLGGYLGIHGPARLAPPLIFMFSTAWSIHMAAGQIVWLPAAFLPLLFMFFLKGIHSDRRCIIIAAFMLSLMVYEGGTYILGFSLLLIGLFTVFTSLQQRSLLPVTSFLAMGLLSVAFSAPKLLPVLEMLQGHPRPTLPEQSESISTYLGCLIDRVNTVDCGSVDSDAYIGIAVIVLYLLSLSLYRTHLPLILTAVVMSIVSFGNFTQFSPWNLLHNLPFFSSFYRGPTRSFMVVGFAIALLVGLYLSRVQKSEQLKIGFVIGIVIILFAEVSPWKLAHGLSLYDGFFKGVSPHLALFTVAIVLLLVLQMTSTSNGTDRRIGFIVALVVCGIGFDLLLVSSDIIGKATAPSNMFPAAALSTPGIDGTFSPATYRISPEDTPRPWRTVANLHRPFSQIRIPGVQRNVHGAWSDQYLAVLNNKGVVDAYETLPIQHHARAVSDAGYRGELYLLAAGSVSLQSWSPNELQIRVEGNRVNRLIINQNFWKGWRASVGEVVNHEGLLAVDLPAGRHNISLRYSPATFWYGMAIFVVAVFGSLAVAVFHKPAKSMQCDQSVSSCPSARQNEPETS